VRQHTITEIPTGHNRNPPILVHCCTGIGRSAVVILSDLLLYILDHNQVSFAALFTVDVGRFCIYSNTNICLRGCRNWT
jgi:protein tyrosine phosphatase